jgi:hypothetical protein
MTDPIGSSVRLPNGLGVLSPPQAKLAEEVANHLITELTHDRTLPVLNISTKVTSVTIAKEIPYLDHVRKLVFTLNH